MKKYIYSQMVAFGKSISKQVTNILTQLKLLILKQEQSDTLKAVLVTPKGGTVLDPFAGSGTTGVACKNLNRNYILIEKEPEYVEIIKKRLNP
jgi:adenine specific DNA methylase Mod